MCFSLTTNLYAVVLSCMVIWVILFKVVNFALLLIVQMTEMQSWWQRLLVTWLLRSCPLPASVSPNPEIPQPGSGNAALPSANASVGAGSEKILVRALSLEMGTGDVQLILRWLLSSSFLSSVWICPFPSLCGLSCCAAATHFKSNTVGFFFLKVISSKIKSANWKYNQHLFDDTAEH